MTILAPENLAQLTPLAGKLAARDLWRLVLAQPPMSQQDYTAVGSAIKRLGWLRSRAKFGTQRLFIAYVRGPLPYRTVYVHVDPITGAARATYSETPSLDDEPPPIVDEVLGRAVMAR